MKGLICYFSITGNTLLACRYIAQEIKSINFELYDITSVDLPDLNKYQIIGFATFVQSLGLPLLMQDFIKRLPQQKQKYSFIFNTYANFYGRTLKIMKDLLKNIGFTTITGHALHAPENYPLYIVKGIIHEDAPNNEELEQFKRFISNLDVLLTNLNVKKEIKEEKLHISWPNNFMPVLSQRRSQRKMGEKFVDVKLCTNCGTCQRTCPYQAIELETKPVFNNGKCYGCWSCYNHCPTQAIYTKKLKGVGHYPKPNKLYQSKLMIK